MELKKIELKELSAKIDPIVSMRDKWLLVTAEDGRLGRAGQCLGEEDHYRLYPSSAAHQKIYGCQRTLYRHVL